MSHRGGTFEAWKHETRGVSRLTQEEELTQTLQSHNVKGFQKVRYILD